VFAEAMPLLVHFMAIGATVIYKSVAPIMLATRGVPEEVGCRGEQVSGVVADEIGRLILKALAG
jgi:hypothetical protein